MSESELKGLYNLREDHRVTGIIYRETLHEIKKKVVEKVIKEGALAGKEFGLDAKNRKLVYQGHKAINPLLTKILSIDSGTGVNQFHWRIATFDDGRFSNLTISTGKAVVHLPEDLTKEEFSEILKVTGITDIDQHNIDWELGSLERRTNLCKIIKEFAD